MPGMFESEAALSERPGFRWIESVEDVSALFSGRTAQQVYAALATAIEESQVSAQDDERSAEMKGE